ncbi:unnamed protein product [Rotaria sp. Silwood2]|nr:unnamed protein product [Rotaria sp. Silwood2]CAF4500165.1 unnamed protein product [Rotaria sp. Silwood2]CAF4590760.1 unnamed protein product [Rotaria sp. Silwood2]
MATYKCYFILLLMIIFMLNKINSQTLSTVPCKPVLDDYFKYLTDRHPGRSRYLHIQATFILQNRYVAYYTGYLSYFRSSNSISGTVTVSFSDRMWTPPCGLTFCPPQNFDYKKTDTQTIVINRLGAIKYILNSWGNAIIKDQLQCYGINEPFYTAPTRQAASMFVMTLQKVESFITK